MLREQIDKILHWKAPTQGLIKQFIIETHFKDSTFSIKIECSFGNFEIQAKIDPLGRYPDVPPVFMLVNAPAQGQKQSQSNRDFDFSKIGKKKNKFSMLIDEQDFSAVN